MRVPWCLWPFGRRSKRRRELSKRKSTRKGTFPERGERTARTTDICSTYTNRVSGPTL